MSSTALLLIFAVACSSLLLASSRKMNIDREALIHSAIAEVEQEFSTVQKVKLSKTQEKLHAFKKATPEALAQGLASLKFERMVKLAEKKILRSQRRASVQTTSSMAEALAMELLHKPGTILSTQEIARMYQESECAETLPTPANCDSPAAIFHRTPDGSCNNREDPIRGAAGTRMRRLIPSHYDDGISRAVGFLQSQGSDLFSGVFSSPNPSARVASIGIVQDREVNDSMHTHILMQWGQFIDHDLDAMPEHETCPDGCEISEDFEGSCYPFAVPEDDDEVLVTRTDPSSRRCHGFKRSLAVCPPDDEPVTELPPREQLNGITHFLDGSMVYGHTAAILSDLRDSASDAGLLRTGPPATVGSDRPLLPDAPPDSFVLCPTGSGVCFLAGDLRINEQSALSVMHTLWVREHNRIAQFIKDNNPSYISNKVFLTTREIVASEIQKITYQDFLPILLGDSYDSLIPPYDTIGYDDTIDPNIPNAFATAAYRFGHSQIQPFFERLGADYESIPAGPLSLIDAFFDTSHVREFGTDPVLRGLLAKPARKVDEFLSSILTNRLFADDAGSPGLDLASLNIQRGRDHGLPKYLTWKQWAKERCGVESEFRNQLSYIRLLQTYGSLDDVDLFVGGLAEEPLPGGVVGAVFGCIFAQTFVALRNGDRFFYENSNTETALFSAEQREQLGRASLARVICDNTDITEVQENAFLANQPRVPCTQLPSVDLSLWNEQVLPETCYIKVGSNTAGAYFSVSRRNTASRFHFHNQAIPAGGEVCYPVLCPEQGGTTILAVVPRQNFQCSPQLNNRLPEPLPSPRHVYIEIVDVDGITASRNGMYPDLASCQARRGPDALMYECDKRFATSQQSGTNSDNLDIDSEDPNELRRLVGDDDITNEIIGGSSLSSSSSSNEEKLVSLMEQMLKELKSAKVSSHEETAEMENDNNLASQLEKVLQKLD